MNQERIFQQTSSNPLYLFAGIRETWRRNPAVMSNANAGFDDLVVRGSDGGNSGITILSGTTSAQGTVAFADGTNGNETYAAYVQYQHNTNKWIEKNQAQARALGGLNDHNEYKATAS